MKSGKHYIFCISIIKSLKKFITIYLNHYYNTEENMIVIRDPKTFYFNFNWPKDVDENMKHDIEFIIKSNESLAENKIKNETEQLLLKYKNGKNIHALRKQQYE